MSLTEVKSDADRIVQSSDLDRTQWRVMNMMLRSCVTLFYWGLGRCGGHGRPEVGEAAGYGGRDGHGGRNGHGRSYGHGDVWTQVS